LPITEFVIAYLKRHLPPHGAEQAGTFLRRELDALYVIEWANMVAGGNREDRNRWLRSQTYPVRPA